MNPIAVSANTIPLVSDGARLQVKTTNPSRISTTVNPQASDYPKLGLKTASDVIVPRVAKFPSTAKCDPDLDSVLVCIPELITVGLCKTPKNTWLLFSPPSEPHIPRSIQPTGPAYCMGRLVHLSLLFKCYSTFLPMA